jgi:hypothetical protein
LQHSACQPVADCPLQPHEGVTGGPGSILLVCGRFRMSMFGLNGRLTLLNLSLCHKSI